MRKLRLFSAVLSLFLLVPASIIWAQVTKTLNGTVRYESGMSETKFTTPNGNVVIYLPQSLAGSVITGTVSTEPSGKTEKEKSRNRVELLKMMVNLDDQKIPITSTPTNFDWLTHPGRSVRTAMELLNASGAKIAEVSLPPALPAPASMGGWRSNTGPVLNTPSRILVKGDMLNVYSPQQFSPGEKFTVTDSKGQQFIVKPMALSANQAVITVPPEAAIGKLTVREVVQDKVGSTEVHLIDISLSSPNTDLRPGQNSFVKVLVTGQGSSLATIDPKITDKDSAEAMQIPIMSIDLRNLHPNTVTMEGGNLQRVHIKQSRQKLMEGEAARIEFQLTRTITGVKPGSFSVSATLHEDYMTSNDPFRPQLNVLQTPEAFNAWADALKKDLVQYAGLWTFGDDGTAYRINQYTQSAIDNMPVCTDPGQLDECKAVAYSLLQPLQVPKGAAYLWLSGTEAYKAAIQSIPSIISGQLQLIDWDIIKRGLDYSRQLGNKLGYDLRSRSDDALQIVKQIQDEGQTKENLEQLNNSLETLNVQANKALNEMPAAMKMLLPGGILFSTKFTPPGTTELPVEVLEMWWSGPTDIYYDCIMIALHFTGDLDLKQLSVRVNWVSKDGKKAGAADFIPKMEDFDKVNFHNCDTLRRAPAWPEDFKAATIVDPLKKDEIDLDKVKLTVSVNGKKVGEGKPGQGKPGK